MGEKCVKIGLTSMRKWALSVLMTAASTFSAVVVLAPVLLGAVLNQYSNNLVRYVSPVMPIIAVTTVGFLCGGAVAQNASAVLASGLQVVLAVVGLHVSGFFFGYMLSRLLGIDVTSARTISIEVGMQNSVLGVVLAAKHFGNPLTAVPCAVSSIWQAIFGSAVAGIWRCTPSDTKELLCVIF
ncbi:putative sodium/metabolite cotransporter BASS1, chloroplastic [Apostasia shenzhenica]|uniref:Putative sodium/metabolite cotransporter BASS1, chloroplastic n=1 Tax=Apostasia shenzhenica TaxID=1088818 RepID=A0A2I0AAK1_9ASPA|nr:putative sodium/metabolite cotransporter BASS1, chloroplastic [Apostasia shenzhenica]